MTEKKKKKPVAKRPVAKPIVVRYLDDPADWPPCEVCGLEHCSTAAMEAVPISSDPVVDATLKAFDRNWKKQMIIDSVEDASSLPWTKADRDAFVHGLLHDPAKLEAFRVKCEESARKTAPQLTEEQHARDWAHVVALFGL